MQLKKSKYKVKSKVQRAKKHVISKGKWISRLFWFGVLVFLLIHCYVFFFSIRFITSDTENLPHNKVGIVLGTSKYLPGNTLNLFFKYRMEAAAMLYFEGKIDKIIVSGDNRTRYYNEPRTMQEELIKLGVPKEDIILDFAGLRTLDSVVRCNKIFGQSKFTVITQQFQNIRAIYIARTYNLEVVGFSAEGVPIAQGFKTYVREIFARIKMLIDIHITKQGPKHLGETVIIQ